MAWENVKCSKCGKDYRVQMYGKHSDREWKQQNWDGICDECNVAHANEDGWNGSAKQIKWAKDIKAQIMAKFDNIELNDLGRQVKAIVENNNDAKYWIDNRFADFQTLMMAVAKENNLI